MAIIRRSNRDGIYYQVRVRDSNGEWFPSQSFSDKGEARIYHANLLADQAKGKQATAEETKQLTFDGYWNIWKSKCRTSSEGWFISQSQMYEDHIAPYLKGKKLREISPTDIADIMSRAKSISLAPQTRLHIYNLLNKMFEDAIEILELRDNSPMRSRLKPTVPKPQRKFLTADIAWSFLESVKKDHFGIGIWLGILGGLRPAEIQGLQWQDIDFGGNKILIVRQWSRKEKRLKQRKNDKSHVIPMVPTLKIFLQITKPKDAKGDHFVCSAAKDRTKMMTYEVFFRALKRLCKREATTVLAPHELRHTSSEVWKDNGANKADIAKLLGNSERAVEAYMHETDERLARLATNVKARTHLALVQSDK